MLALGVSAMIYFFFGIAQFQYKITARENIAKQKELSVIKIPVNEFKKQANNDEVWYGGKLYDISSYTIENNIAYVVIFHDEQEESLMKSIADNFELYDKYVSDNAVHIVKHKVHIPDDNKIKISTTALALICDATEKTSESLPYFIKYSSPLYGNVLKPPPDLS